MPLEVGPADHFEILQDAALQLPMVGQADFVHVEGSLFAPNAPRAVAHNGLALKTCRRRSHGGGEFAEFIDAKGNCSGKATGLNFKGVAGVDPAQKTALLAEGVSEAMIGTAFGLVIAIPTLVISGWLTAKTQQILDDIHEISVATLNLIIQNRDKFPSK